MGMKITVMLLSFILFGFSLSHAYAASEYSYIIYIQNGITFAQNGNTGMIDFQSSNSSYVFQQALNSNVFNFGNAKSIFIKSGVYWLNNPINIPNQVLIQGEGSGISYLVANKTMDSMITKTSGIAKIYLKDIMFDGNGMVNNVVNLYEPRESSYHVILSNVDIEHGVKNNLVLDGEEDSLIDTSVIANPSGHGNAIHWYVNGGNAWVRSSFVSGDMVIQAQQVTVRDSTIEHINTGSGEGLLQLDSVYFNLSTKYGNAINMTGPVDDLLVHNCYVSLSNGETFLIGKVQKNIRLENNFFDLVTGGTATVIPDQSKLQALFYPSILGTIHTEGMSGQGNVILSNQNNEFTFYSQ